MEEKLKLLYIKPYELPIEMEIDNTLEAKQKLVGGSIECVYPPNDKDVIFICNDEGKLNGMRLNRDIGFDILAGPFFIVGRNLESNEYKSLTTNQILKYKIKFDENSIIRTENKILGILLGKNRDYERYKYNYFKFL